jgi:RNA polymerase sigma factor (sigma-70 family)
MGNYNDLHDQQLIRLYKEGNVAVFKILYDRHQKSVYSAIYKLVKNKPLADDIFQEVFLRAIENIKDGRYNEEGKFIHWILRIAHNLCMDTIRKQKRSRPTYSISDETFEGNFISSIPDAESLMISTQSQSSIFKMIELLPHEQQEVIILRHYAGLSFKNIACITKCSTNTALGRMRYGVLNLRKLINDNSNLL